MIYQKLSEIQKELFVPKGQKNTFGKYNYRSCEDILKAVKPICEKNGCVLTITNSLENIGDRFYVKATAVLVELETGERIESVAHAREEAEKKGMDGSQITGASSSYARKYALAGLFCIDNEADSDATNTHGKKKSEQVEMTLEEAENYKFSSGKYKDLTVKQVIENMGDQNYIDKLAEGNFGNASVACKIVCDEQLRQIAGVK